MITLTFLSVLALTPNQTLAEVQAAYKKGGDFSATFTQTYVDKLRGKKKTASGKLWAKSDGRVRWSYEKPAPSDFYFTGTTAYFYEPDNAQVTVFEKFQDSPLWNALRFLWGQGSLAETFEATACTENCPKAEAGTEVLKLTPKAPIAAVDHVVVVVDTKEKRVRRSIVYDSLGNRTEYEFSNVSFGQTLDAKKFQFEIPKGVSILRATSQGT